jgi:hypothetical protein
MLVGAPPIHATKRDAFETAEKFAAAYASAFFQANGRNGHGEYQVGNVDVGVVYTQKFACFLDALIWIEARNVRESGVKTFDRVIPPGCQLEFRASTGTGLTNYHIVC